MPHRGGPLGEGDLKGQIVTCPWHGWQYDVTTGKLATNPAVGVENYPVEVRGDDIFVDNWLTRSRQGGRVFPHVRKILCTK